MIENFKYRKYHISILQISLIYKNFIETSCGLTHMSDRKYHYSHIRSFLYNDMILFSEIKLNRTLNLQYLETISCSKCIYIGKTHKLKSFKKV